MSSLRIYTFSFCVYLYISMHKFVHVCLDVGMCFFSFVYYCMSVCICAYLYCNKVGVLRLGLH